MRPIVPRIRPHTQLAVALFTDWDCGTFVADWAGEPLELEADHRRHAVIERSIAELKSARLAHLPLGTLTATAAWLVPCVRGECHQVVRAGPLDEWSRPRAVTAGAEALQQ